MALPDLDELNLFNSERFIKKVSTNKFVKIMLRASLHATATLVAVTSVANNHCCWWPGDMPAVRSQGITKNDEEVQLKKSNKMAKIQKQMTFWNMLLWFLKNDSNFHWPELGMITLEYSWQVLTDLHQLDGCWCPGTISVPSHHQQPRSNHINHIMWHANHINPLWPIRHWRSWSTLFWW